MTGSKKYVFDLDGTLCTITSGDYQSATPFVERIAIVNDLYAQGHHIVINTARGMGRFENDPILAKAEFEEVTRGQLERWGVKYHELFLGKPSGDFYIDDKAVKDTDFFDSKTH
jgi:capsule biosynthesis phosphatase